jgi:autotransporter-associated beta strand protein
MKTTTFHRFYTLTALILVLLAAPHLYAATDVTISSATTAGITPTFSSGTCTYTPNAGAATAIIKASELNGYLATYNVIINTASTGAGTNGGSITLSSQITWSSTKGLTLNALTSITTTNNIVNLGSGTITLLAAQGAAGDMSIGGDITTNNGAITLYAGLDGSGTDLNKVSDINISAASTISSSGADINMKNSSTGGRTNVTSGAGICFNATTTIDAGGGNITLNGTGANASSSRSCGVWLWSSTTIQTTGSGTINITGKGLSGASYGEGIMFDASTYDIHTGDGAITLNATSATSGATGVAAIDCWNNGTTSIYSTNGPININANTRNTGYSSFNLATGHKLYLGHNNGSTITTGDITIYGDVNSASQTLFSLVGTATIKGTGNLLIGSSPTVANGTSSFTVPSGMLSGGSWKKISLGDVRTGSITVSDNITNVSAGDNISIISKADITLNNPVTNNATGKSVTVLAAQGASGTLTMGGALTTAGGSVILNAGVDASGVDLAKNANIIVGNSITSNNGDITIKNSTASVSRSASPYGIDIAGATSATPTTISSGTGAITITGNNSYGANNIRNIGLRLFGSNVNSISGNITIFGKVWGATSPTTAEVCGLFIDNGSAGRNNYVSSTSGKVKLYGRQVPISCGGYTSPIGLYATGATLTKIYSLQDSTIINSYQETPYTNTVLSLSLTASNYVYVGWDGGTNVTTGNVSITAGGTTGGMDLTALKVKSNGGAVKIGDNGSTMGSITLSSGSIDPSGNYKSFDIGGTKTGVVTLNTPLTTNVASTAGILVASKSDITINNPLNTAAASGVPISLLAAQGAAGTGTLVTATTAPLTTNNGAINLRSGVSADGSVVSTAAGNITVNGAVTMGVAGSQPIDWKSSADMILSTSLNTSYTANIPISLTSNMGADGIMTINTNYDLTTAGGAVSLLAGTSTKKGSILSNGDIATAGGNITIQNTSVGTDGTRDCGVVIQTGILTAGAGNVSISGWGGTGTWQEGVRLNLNGAIQTGAGNITINGKGGVGTKGSSGILIENNYRVNTGSGNITLNGEGAASGTRQDGIWFYGGTGTQKIYSTSGNITLYGKAAYADQAINTDYNGAGEIAGYVYIGSPDGVLAGTTGDINIYGETAATGGQLIWQSAGSHGVFAVKGTGKLAIQNYPTNPVGNGGFILYPGSLCNSIWKSVTLGDIYTGNIGVTVNDNIITSAAATDGVSIIAKTNITVNKPISTSAKASMPITLLAAQGAAGTLTTATAGTLTTDNGIINLRSGVNADASTAYNVAGHMVINGLVNYTSAPLAIDWRTAGNMAINTPLNTSAVAGLPITLLGGQKSSAGGKVLINGNLITQNADITLYSGLDATGTETGVTGCVGLLTGAIVNAGTGNILIKNTSLGSPSPEVSYADRSGIQLNLINTTTPTAGYTIASSGVSTLIGKDITLNGTGIQTATESRGIDDGGSLINASGNILLTGTSGTSATISGDGIRFLADGGAVTHTIKTTGATSTITLNANGKNSSYAGISIWSNQTNTVNIYNTNGTGNIAINATCANTANGRPFYDERSTTATANVNIGWDGTTNAANVTNGDIIMKLTGGVNQTFVAAPHTFLKTNGGNVSIIDDGTNALGAITLPLGMMTTTGSYKSFTIGGVKTTGITINDNLTTNAVGTAGILVTSKTDLTTNGILSTFANTATPITLLAAQGATGDLWVKSNLTTNGGLIKAYAGLDASGTETTFLGSARAETASIISSNGADITIQNTTKGGTGVLSDEGLVTLGSINAEGTSAGGNITLKGYGKISASYVEGIYLNGTVKTNFAGNIDITGKAGAGSQRSMGIFIGENNNTTVHTEAGNITMTGTGGNGSWNPGFGLAKNNSTTKIYSTSGNISMSCPSTNGDPVFYGYSGNTGGGTFYIGYDGQTSSLGTTGDITILGDTKATTQNALLWQNSTTLSFKGQGNLRMGSYGTVGTSGNPTTFSNTILGTAWKSISIGDNYSNPFTVNDNLTLASNATGGISIISKGDITVNNPINASAKSGMPIKIYAAQGLTTATGTLTTNSGGTLTTDNAAITLRSGVSEDNATISTAAAHITVNGAVSMGATGAWPIDWRSSANMTISTNLNTSVTASKPVSLIGALGANGLVTLNNDITTKGGDVTINAGTATAKGSINLVAASDIVTSGGNVTVQNAAAGGYTGTYDLGVYHSGTINAGTGNIVLTGTGALSGGGGSDGIEIDAANTETTTGSITITGIGGNGNSHSAGVLFGGGADKKVHTVSGDITINGTGATGGNRPDAIWFWGSGCTNRIYSTSGNISFVAKTQSTADGHGILSGYYNNGTNWTWNYCNLFVGYDGGTGPGTTGNISVTGDTKVASAQLIHTNTDTRSFIARGQKDLTMQSIQANTTGNGGLTINNGMVSTGNWRNITIGDKLMGASAGITVNDNLVTNAASTTGIVITSAGNITQNNPVSTAAKAAMPITLLAAQGAAGTGTLTTATAGTLTTNGGVIMVRSGVNADASVVSTATGDVTVNGAVTTGATAVPFDWRASRSLRLNTDLSTLATAAIPISLYAGQGISGDIDLNGSLSTQNGVVKVYGGLKDDDVTPTGFGSSIQVESAKTITTNGGDVMIKNSTIGGGYGSVDTYGRGLLLVGTPSINAKGATAGGNITLYGKAKTSGSYLEGLYLNGNIETNFAGKIDMTGIAGNGTSRAPGIYVGEGGNTNVITKDGDITLTGTGGPTGAAWCQGILFNASTNKIYSTTGNITMNMTSKSGHCPIFNNTATTYIGSDNGSTITSGNIKLLGDDPTRLIFEGAGGAFKIQGSGSLYLQSLTAIGNNGITSTTNIVGSAWKNIYLGDANTGSIICNDALTTTTGGITVVTKGEFGGSGAINSNGNPLSITTATTTASPTYSGVISGAGSLTKLGAGLLLLTNPAHTFTGKTILTAGELRLNPTAIATWTSPIELNGGTLSTTNMGAYTFTSSSTLNLTAGSTLALGTSNHTLIFANSSGLTWAPSQYLNVTGWQTSLGASGTQGKLKFALTPLTATQLSQFKFNQSSTFYPGATIAANEVVPSGYQAKFVSVKTGYWNDPDTWGLQGSPIPGVNYPGPASKVVIAADHNVTLTANTATSDSLSFAAKGTLTMGTYSMGVGSLTGANVGAIISGTTGALSITNTDASTFAGIISGTGGLTKAGTGSLTLSGANTYTGATTISAGNVEIAGAGVLGSGTYAGAISVASGSIFKYNSTATQTVSGIVSGAGALTKDNTGSLTLSAANTLTGATTVTAGNLVWSGMGIGSNNTNITGGYQLTTSALAVAAGATVTVTNGTNDFSSANGGTALSGAGTIIKSGTGKWWLGNAGGGTTIAMLKNGLIDIQAGWIKNDNSNSAWSSNLGSMNIAAGATMDLRNNDVYIDALTGSGTLDNNYTVAKTVIVGVANSSSTFNGVIGSSAGLLYLGKNGTGTLTLTGVNTYTGVTTISGGTLVLSGAGSLGGGAYANSISIATGATLNVNSTAAQTLSNVISGAGALVKNNTGVLTLTASNSYTGGTTINGGTINANSNPTFANNALNTITVNSGTTLSFGAHWGLGGNTTINTPLIINGGTVTNNGNWVTNFGPITFNGGTMTYTGGADAQNHSIMLGGTVTVTDNSTISGTTSANFGVNLANVTVADGVFNIQSGKTLTISAPLYNRNNSTTVYASNLIKTGAGTLLLTGTASHTGTTTLSQGELRLNPSANLAWASPMVLNGGTLSTVGIGAYNITSTSTLGLTDNSIINFDPTTAHALTFANSSAVAWTSSKSLLVNGWQGSTGTTGTKAKVNFNTTTLTATQLGMIKFNYNSGFYATSSIGSNPYELVPGTAADSPYFTSVQTGNWNDPATWGRTGTPTAGVNYPGSGSRVTIASNHNVSLNSNVAISDSLKFAANGTLTMGTYTMAASSLTGTNAGATISMGGATSFTLTNTNASSFAGAITGASGSLIKAGTGSLTLTGANTYTGATTINAGNVEITGASVLGGGTYAGAISIASSSTLKYNSTATQFFNGVISGAGALIKDQASTLTLNGANTYTGATTITTGTLVLSNTNTSPNYSIANGAVLETNIATGNTISWPSATTIAGAGTFRKTGSGWFNVNNGSQWNWNLTSGALIDIQAGTFTMCGGFVKYFTNNHADLNIASGAIAGFQESFVIVNNLTGSGTLQFGYSNNASYTCTVGIDGGSSTFDGVIANFSALSSNPGNLVKAGAGTLTLTGVNTYTGTTTVNGGILALNGAGQLNAGSYGNTIAVATGTTLNINSTAVQTFSGVISGAGSLVKNNTGALTLTASNTFTGGTTINGGTINANAGITFAINPTNTVTVNSGGTLSAGTHNIFGANSQTITTPLIINGGTVTNNGAWYSGFGPLTLNGGAITSVGGLATTYHSWALRDVTVTDDATISAAGANSGINLGVTSSVTGSNFNISSGKTLTIAAPLFNGLNSSDAVQTSYLTKSGAGTLVLSGAGTYTGTTAINAGTVLVNNITALGTNSAVTFANDASAILDMNGYNLSVGSLSGGGTAGGKITSGLTGMLNLTIGGDNATKTFSGLIEDGSGTISIVKNGSGVQSIDGTNTYTGTTTVNAGTWQLGAGGTTGAFGTSDVILASGATFSVNQSDPVTIANKITGSGIFTQAGAGITTLTAANDYTGATNINAGTLQIGDGSNSTARTGTGALAVGANTLLINLNGTATLGNSSVTQSVGGVIDNQGTGKVTFANGVDAGIVDGGTAGLVMSNAITNSLVYIRGDVTLGGTNTGSIVKSVEPGTTMHVSSIGGTFWWLGADNIANAPNIDIASGVTLSTSSGQTAYLYFNNLTGAGNFTMAGSGAQFYVLGNSTMTGTLTVNQPLFFGNGGTAGTTISSPIVNNSSVTFNSTTDNTFSGTMTGGGTVIKNNTNTVKFTNPTLAYTGTTSIYAGTLKLNPTATTATLASQMYLSRGTLSTVGITTGTTITSSSTLFVNDNSTLDLEPTGTHNLKFANSSGLTWTANQILTVKGWQGAYSGTTGTDAKFFGGTAAGQFSAAQVAQTKFYNGTNYYAASQLATGEAVAGAATYATGFISVATGDWNAPATWGYSGTAVAGTTYPSATDNATISTGHTVTLKAATTAAAITATGTLNLGLYNMTIGNLNGAGNVTLGANTLTLGDATTTASFSGIISGSGSLVKQNAGTQTLANQNTFTGGTTVNNGKLIANNGTTNLPVLKNVATNILTVNSGGIFSIGGHWAIEDLMTVVINAGGTLTTEGAYTSNLGPLTLNGGTLTNTVSGQSSQWKTWHLQGTVLVTDNSSIIGVGTNNGLNLGSSGSMPFIGFDVAAGKTLTVSANMDNRYSGGWIAAPLVKTGTGTLILNGTNWYTGATTISQGLVQLTSTNSSPSYDIASGAVLEENCSVDKDHGTSTTYTGTGIFRKTGTGNLYWGGTAGTFAFSAGALIDVQAGKFTGGSSNNEVWTNNMSDLNVASGAIFNTVEATVNIDKLTGSGTIGIGMAGNTPYLNVGINNATSSFGGLIQNTDAIAGNLGNLVKLGTGTLTLTNPTFTYTGTTKLTAGTLKLNPSATTATWATSKVIFNGGTLSTAGIATGTTMTCAGTILLTDNSTLDLDNTAATHTLKFANSTAEAWTAGKFLTITDWSGAYNTTTGTKGHLVIGTGTTVTTSLTAAQLLQARFSDGTLLYNTAMIATAEAVPAATAFATNFVSVATGTWDNPATWGYTGTATAGVNYPGTSDKATVSTGNTVTLTANTTTSGALTLNGTIQTGDYNLTTGDFSGSGTISLGNATLSVGGTTTPLTYSGVINGTGSLTKTGTGILILSGINTYTGTTTINAGTLKAGSTTAFGNLSDVTVATGATMDLNGNANSIGSLSGGGSVIASAALTLGDNTNATFSGVISGGGALIKAGSGTLILSGLNTFTGTTTVSAGELQIGGAGTLAAGTYTNAIAIASGATLTYNSTANQTFSGTISGAGNLNKNNTSTLTLTAANSLTGNINVNAGTLTGNFATDQQYGCIGHANLITVNNGGTLMSANATNNTLVGYSGTILLKAGGVLDISSTTSAQTLGNLILAGGEVKGAGVCSGNSLTSGRWLFGTGCTLTVNAGSAVTSTISAIGFNPSNANFIVNNSGASNGVDLNITGTLVNSNGFTKSGAGVMSITGTNTYTGATIINAGMVKAGNASALGVGSALSFANDATAILDMNGNNLSVSSLAGGGILGGKITNSQGLASILTVGSANTNTTFSGKIQDDVSTVGLTKVGTGTLTLDGANTCSGAILISAGTLQVGAGAVKGSLGTSAITNNSALIFNRADNVSFANAIGGTGTLTQSGAGMLSLSGANAYTGNTTINSGTLEIAGSGKLGGGAYGGTIYIASGTKLSYNTTSAQTLSGIISGPGSVTKENTGTLTLSAANTYIGGTTINAGTLVAAKDPLTFANNANNTVLINSGATLCAGANNIFGAIYLTGTNVVTPLIINGGTLTTNGLYVSQLGPLTMDGGTITNTVGAWPTGPYHSWLFHDVSVNDDATINAVGTNAGIGLGAITPAGTTFSIASSKTLTINAPLYDGLNSSEVAVASYLTKTGGGTLVLGGANAYTGLTTISAGTVKLGTATSLGTSAGATTLAAGAVLDLNGTSYTTAEPLTLNGTGILAGGAIVNSSSTAASFSGAITLGSASSVIANNGITLAGNVTNAGFGLELGGTATGSVMSGVISGAGAVTKNGAGTWKYSNNTSHTYTGLTTINTGELRLNPTSNGATFASKIVLNGGTLSTTGINTGYTWTSTSTLSITDNSTIALEPTNPHTLTFATSNTETWSAGKLLNITGWKGTNGAAGTKGKIFVGNLNSTLGSYNLANAQFTLAAGIAKSLQLNTGELVPGVIPVISYTTPNSYIRNTAITSLSPTVTAGSPITGYTVNKALPAGLALNATTGVISGTPTAMTATDTYRVTATNASGTGFFDVVIAVNGITYAVTFAAPTNGTLTVMNGSTPVASGDLILEGTALTVTATPSAGYALSTLTANSTDVVSNSVTVSTATAIAATFAVPTWTGTTSTDWNTATNWTPNVVPTALHDVIVPTTTNAPLAADNSLCRNLTINSGAVVTIPAGKSLTVSGSITNNAGASGLIVKSDPVLANGTLIFNNAQNAPVQASVEMYSKASWNMANPVQERYKWQFFGVPVRTLAASPVLDGAIVRQYDETKVTTNWTALTTASSLLPFSGYEISQPAAKTYTLTGDLVNADLSQTLTKTTGAATPGSQVLSNPYTAAIDITKLNFGSQTESTVYLYNTGSITDWTTYSGSTTGANPGQYTAAPKSTAGTGGIPNQIPSMQGFVVKAISNDANATFGIPYSAVAIKNTDAQRARSAIQSTTGFAYSIIDVVGVHGGDRMWLFTDASCTHNFDNSWDGRKMFGSALVPQLFAKEPDGDYQVNAVNNVNNTNLGFQAGTDSEYKLRFTHVNTQSVYDKLYLLDNVTGVVTDISTSGTEYSFTAQTTSEPTTRFKILSVLDAVMGETPVSADADIKVFSSGKTIFVRNTTKERGDLMVFDVTGRFIDKLPFNPTSTTAIPVKLIPGVYVVTTVVNNQKAVRSTVIIP